MSRTEERRNANAGRAEVQRVLQYLAALPAAVWAALERRDPAAVRLVVSGLLGLDTDETQTGVCSAEKITREFRAVTRRIHPDQFLHTGDENLVREATLAQTLLLQTRPIGLLLDDETFWRERKKYQQWLQLLKESKEKAQSWGIKETIPSSGAVQPVEAAPSPHARDIALAAAAPPQQNGLYDRKTAAGAPQKPPRGDAASQLTPQERARRRLRSLRPIQPPPAYRSAAALDSLHELDSDEVRWILVIETLAGGEWQEPIQSVWTRYAPSRPDSTIGEEERKQALAHARSYAASLPLWERFLEGERKVLSSELWAMAPFELLYMQEVAAPRLRERIRPTTASEADRIPMSPQMVDQFVRDVFHRLAVSDQRRVIHLLKMYERAMTTQPSRPVLLQREDMQVFGRFRSVIAQCLKGRSPDQRAAIWQGVFAELRAGKPSK